MRQNGSRCSPWDKILKSKIIILEKIMTRKTESLRVRITPEENEAFIALALNMEESRSRLVRKMVREAITGNIDLLTDEQSLLKIAIRQLIGIANNLNQITATMHANTTPPAIDMKYLEELKEYVYAVKSELVNYVKHTTQRWITFNKVDDHF
jgi:hypothetical protein